jgi:hypothetical protein
VSRQRSVASTIRLIRCLVSLLLVASTRASAQGDTVLARPTSAREAVALGVKLLGIYDRNTGEWIARAVVRDTLGHELLSSKSGLVALNALAPVLGAYLLEVSKPGYQTQRVRIAENGGAEFMIALEPDAVGAARLPAVVTEARVSLESDPGLADGFFRRCEAGVKCVGRRDLDLHPTAGLPDLLARVNGIHLQCAVPMPVNKLRTGSRDIRNNSLDYASECGVRMVKSLPDANDPYCAPTYFVNGRPWHPETGTGDSQEQLSKVITPATISGIEVYLPNDRKPVRFEMPPLKAQPRCGAVVIWTR